jgi:hypothetical protein
MPILEGVAAVTVYRAYDNLFQASMELLGDLTKRGVLEGVEKRPAALPLGGGGRYDSEAKDRVYLSYDYQ